jgi:hypothetical protein
MGEYFNLISDEKELTRYFEEIMPPLESQETYFFSLSARNKYLTEEEREELCLGRTEMFERRTLRTYDYQKFIRLIHKFECNPAAYTTKNNSIIPSKCIICYVNINPSNMLKAYTEFNYVMQEYILELSLNALNGRSLDDISDRLSRIDRLLLDKIQKARGRRVWIDIDFDVPKNSPLLSEYIKELKENQIKFEVIDTHSGYHILLKRETIKYNYLKTLEVFDRIASEVGGEIKQNKNEMVPLPGTFQGGYPVRIVTEEYL